MKTTLRRLASKLLLVLMWVAEKTRWPWLAFRVMDWQRQLGLPYERTAP